MVDCEILDKAFKLSLSCRLKTCKSQWTKIPNYYFDKFGGLNLLLQCNYDVKLFPTDIPKYYRDGTIQTCITLGSLSSEGILGYFLHY